MNAFKSRASIEPKELAWLLAELVDLKPKVVVEIGVHKGYSLEVWRTWLKPEVLIGIDYDVSQLDYKDADIIKGDSTSKSTIADLYCALGGDEIDFLFLDGDHTYDTVKADYENYGEFVRKGGIIAFHDAAITDHPLVDVHKLMKELPDVKVYQSDGTGMAILCVK